jgi:endonuclease/exonuclease/phosphatase family metal-dependent hydrolase
MFGKNKSRIGCMLATAIAFALRRRYCVKWASIILPHKTGTFPQGGMIYSESMDNATTKSSMNVKTKVSFTSFQGELFMKKVFGLLVAISALVALMANSLSAQYPDTVKIMTYNINYESNKNTQYDGIITVIKAIDPAIAGLQKLDSCMGTGSNPCYVAKLLGDQTNMSYTFVTGDPESYGDGFLSKQPPKSVRKIKLTGAATIPRAAIEIGVTVGGEPVRVIVTHLDLSAANRTSEMQQILSWIDNGGAKTIPAVIMADFNAGPTEDCMKQLTTAGFVFVKTASGQILDTSSGQGINHMLYRPEDRWTLVDAGNPKYAASNRNPVWALLALKNPVGAVSQKSEKADRINPSIRASNNGINCFLPLRAIVSMRLFDPSGKKVRTLLSKRMLEAGPHVFTLPENGLTKGMYLLESTIDGVKAFERIAVIR